MSAFLPPEAPPSKLGIYRVLSPKAGVRVSPLVLGGASIGSGDSGWKSVWGDMDEAKAYRLLDKFYELGGNFIDTANNYQEETSEQIIGKWAEERRIRDQLFIATKYTSGYKKNDTTVKQKVQYVGNNAKSLHLSVEASLKKLRTSYLDLLYVHWWDFDCSVQEVMDALHNIVAQGKVIYLGVSDTPAWIVSEANTYARMAGKTPFVIYQGAWNVMERSFERDIIPMARAHGLALSPWNVLAGGKLRTDSEEKAHADARKKGDGRQFPGAAERNEKEIAMSRALEKIAREVEAKSIRAVAIAYLLQKTTYVFPVLGGRKPENWQQNIEALDISLSPTQIKEIEDVVPLDPGFPNNFIGDGSDINFFLQLEVNMQRVSLQQPLKPGNGVTTAQN
ncbi:arylalcohol dehydrogenase [Dendrothele bispora CBS 962.96]|uniref:Arylalcohol dehydrogenase n=1 Tax=Dendrothele bispora (strain CBS 962.96) TaxID=1314807 RepID=A0A4S8L5D3_DENBC|nr:arylalcohol dehydrogenase [Dendrothele bispora CBS 962.96]